MRERCVTAIAVLFSFFAVSAWSAAMVQVRGELTCEVCNYYTGYAVELQGISGSNASERAVVRSSGEFDARVEAGDYTLTVIAAGAIVANEHVSLRDGFSTVTIRIPSPRGGSKPGAGIVSVARMRHKVPKEAKKAFNLAEKKHRSGNIEGSLEDLKRATELDAEYLEAWNNLGCRYLAKGQTAEALAALEHAASIDKGAPFVFTNIGIAQAALRNYASAEGSTRTALSIDPTDTKARYVLGMTLVAQRKYTEETVKLLRQVEGEFPLARMALAETLAMRGNIKEAKVVLQDCLSSADEQTRPQAEAMLASLK